MNMVGEYNRNVGLMSASELKVKMEAMDEAQRRSRESYANPLAEKTPPFMQNKRKGVFTMFTYKEEFEINSHDVIDFVRLLGRIGMRFEFSDEYCMRDDLDPTRKIRFRRFYVTGTRRQFNKFYEARDMLWKYRLH